MSKSDLTPNMAKYEKVTASNGFVRGTEAGVYVTYGAVAHLKVSIKVHAKTVSNVFSQLVKEKSHFSKHTWDEIQSAHAEGHINFFYGLLNIMAGGSYDWSQRKTTEDIKSDKEAQAVKKAFLDSDTSDVS